jgi:predicted ABC-type sugar transport system permease subunit
LTIDYRLFLYCTPKFPYMSEKKTSNTSIKLFEKQNLWLMLAGLGCIAIGMLIMVGGKSADPSVFNEKEVYSFTRISLAPILIIAGLVIEIYAIFKKPKA